ADVGFGGDAGGDGEGGQVPAFPGGPQDLGEAVALALHLGHDSSPFVLEGQQSQVGRAAAVGVVVFVVDGEPLGQAFTGGEAGLDVVDREFAVGFGAQ